LFQNLFLPSVKLRRKVRVGSKLKRIYDSPQTPFQRVCASKQAIPAKVAELQQWRDTLDPFELSQQIERKLEHIFQLSSSTGSQEVSDPQRSQFSTTIHRKKKEPKKKE
jgi:RNA processing factor Prp31